MKFLRTLPAQTRRDAWVEINLGAIEHNTRSIRAMLPHDVAMMAIVKADAYGHGAVMAIPTLEASGISMVGVAAMDEAIQIRKSGIEIPVLVIGAIPDWAVQVAADHDVSLTIFDDHHLEALRKSYSQMGRRVKVHVKVDTGMHRIGIHWEDAAAFIQKCRQADYMELEGVFSHLACVEDPEFTRRQHDRFQSVLDQLETPPRYVHLANSAAALLYPECRYNLVRPGIALFGYLGAEIGAANLQPSGKPMQLVPVMSLKARIVHLQDVPPASGVSYGHTFKAPQGSSLRIATLPLGYADGIPRLLSNRMEGLLRGHRVRQVGNVTMDQLMFDVTGVPDVDVGEAITLIGEEDGHRITFTDWAKTLGTIEYELMCSLRVRLPKTYTRD